MMVQATSENAETVIGHPSVGMDAALKAEWVEALRGGKYPQGKWSLFDGASYCCLGVAAEIAGIGFDLQSICTGVQLGLTEAQAERLINMNDGTANEASYPFTEIADYIEANIPARAALAGAKTHE